MVSRQTGQRRGPLAALIAWCADNRLLTLIVVGALVMAFTVAFTSYIIGWRRTAAAKRRVAFQKSQLFQQDSEIKMYRSALVQLKREEEAVEQEHLAMIERVNVQSRATTFHTSAATPTQRSHRK